MRAARPQRASLETLCALLLTQSLLGGCAHSLVQDGAVRPDLYEELVERTARTRGITPDRALPVRIITRSQIPELTRGSIETHWDSDSLDAYQDSLVALGLWPPDRDLVEEYVAVGSEESAGFYRPSHRTLYVVDDARIPFSLRLASWLTRRDVFRELALSHEIVHALQHQAHPWLLEEAIAWRQQDDAAMAIRAAIEGDATLYGFMVTMNASSRYDLPAPDLLRKGMDQEMENLRSDSALATTPALVRYSLPFPYVTGYGLSYEQGTALLEDPPISTEQVLHPKRRRSFVAVDLRDARSLLPGGCRLLDENTLGEFGISILLRDHDGTVSPDAWQGWDGDRYLAARCGDQREFVWLTSWDSWADADQFARAYAEIAGAVGARAMLTAPPRIERREHEVWIASEGLVAWTQQIAAAARRRRVSRLEELRAHFAEPADRSEEQ